MTNPFIFKRDSRLNNLRVEDRVKASCVTLEQFPQVPGVNPTANQGKIWVKTGTPSTLVFTNNQQVDGVLVTTSGSEPLEDDFQVADNSILFDEVSGFLAPGAGKGRLWVKNDTPSSLIFTNDIGTDISISTIGGGDFLSDGTIPMTGDLQTSTNAIEFTESATVPNGVPTATKGKLWVRNDTPNTVIFTDDAGTDHNLVTAGAGTGDFLADGSVPMTGTLDLTTSNAIIVFDEKAAAPGSIIGKGQVWVNQSPHGLMFTHENGPDIAVTPIVNSIQTVGAVTSTVSMIPIPNNSVTGIKVLITSANTTDNQGSFHSLETVYKNIGGTLSQVDSPETETSFSDVGYVVDESNINLLTSGTDVLIRVTGVTGKNINWKSSIETLTSMF